MAASAVDASLQSCIGVMTKIDRYIFTLFARTVTICFCSLAGVFVVFHAFNHLDDLTKQVAEGDSVPLALARYYGPYLLMLFDWTAAIIALISMLFTIGWLRRSGELTALLAAGVPHGRIVRPMIALSFAVVLLQLANREWLVPRYRDLLTSKPGEIGADYVAPMLPTYDKSLAILIEGDGLKKSVVESPSFRLYGAYPEFGDVIAGKSAQWREASAEHEAGYLVAGVTRPPNINELSNAEVTFDTQRLQAEGLTLATLPERTVLYAPKHTPWLRPGECFIASSINPEVLQDNPRSTRMAAMPELIRRIRNPAVHSSDALKVMLHERVIRTPLDLSLVLLGLPLIVNRGDKRLFSMIAQAMGLVLLFFGLKTLASGMGGSGYFLGPAMAAWLPLIVLGPIALVRYRDIQFQ